MKIEILQLYKLTVVCQPTDYVFLCANDNWRQMYIGKRQQVSTCPLIGVIVLPLYIITTPKVHINMK